MHQSEGAGSTSQGSNRDPRNLETCDEARAQGHVAKSFYLTDASNSTYLKTF